MQPKMNTRGGSRPGSGRKLIYGEPTTQIGFKVPISKAYEIRNKILRILKKYERHV